MRWYHVVIIVVTLSLVILYFLFQKVLFDIRISNFILMIKYILFFTLLDYILLTLISKKKKYSNCMPYLLCACKVDSWIIKFKFCILVLCKIQWTPFIRLTDMRFSHLWHKIAWNSLDVSKYILLSRLKGPNFAQEPF